MNPSTVGGVLTPNPNRRRHHTGSVDDAESDHAQLRPLAQNRRSSSSGSWGGVDESDEDVSVAVVTFQEQRQSENVRDDVEVEMFRRRVAFFFLNPYEKYLARRRFPYKLAAQFLKAFLVTWLLCKFAQYRYAHTKYYTDNRIAFEHLFLKGWDSVREIHAYPPATGVFAIYRKPDFYSYFDYVADTFYNLEDLTVNPVFRNSSFDFCVEHFDAGRGVVASDLSWSIKDWHAAKNESFCISVPYEELKNFSSSDYLKKVGCNINWDTMTSMHINFTLQTLTYTRLGPLLGPECFSFHTKIVFDNSDFDGQIPVDLQIGPRRRLCPKKVQPQLLNLRGPDFYLTLALNYTVMTLCAVSLVLCFRALVRAQVLRRDATIFFKAKFDWDLGFYEKLDFVNGWYMVILINDLMIIAGCIIKQMIESRNTLGDLWDYCSIFLGVGDLLVWIGMLRYVTFFKDFNVLILTMKKAIPNVLRYMLCAIIIYTGFVFSGWIILGPYHFKFQSLWSTSECLFSLVNGDDMFATFSSTPATSKVVWYFSKVYLYSFISLFIYMILSLFIAIIMDTYELIKDYYANGFPKERLHEFYKSANYDPTSGVFQEAPPQQQQEPRGSLLRRVFTQSAFPITTPRENGRVGGGDVANERTPLLT